jgi:hypothetical protein
MGPTTPIPAPYVSPSLHSAGSRPPPPFSLGPPMSGDLDMSNAGLALLQGGVGSPNNNNSSGLQAALGGPNPPAGGTNGPVNLNLTPGGQQQNNAGRGGTDPTKYKTTICRNWEQTGGCQFRGCTFAHGVDDLRPPARPTNNQLLSSVPQTALHALLTLPSGSQAASNAVVDAMGSSTGTNPQLNGVGAVPSTNSSSNAAANALLSAGTLRIEQIAELLVVEVNRQRDLVSVHLEANRTLENMLRREQQLRAEASARLSTIEKDIETVKRENALKDQEIAQLTQILDQQSKKAMEAFASTFQTKRVNAPGGHGHSSASSEKGDISDGSSGSPLAPPPSLQSGTRQSTFSPSLTSPTIASPTAPDEDRLLSILNSLNLTSGQGSQ